MNAKTNVAIIDPTYKRLSTHLVSFAISFSCPFGVDKKQDLYYESFTRWYLKSVLLSKK